MFDTVVYYICVPLGYLMKWCWQLVGNYGVAIILFTLLSKIVILPVTVWVHKNSIKMIKIQPEINFLKAKYYGDLDRIGEKQTELFKREKYRPIASLVSLLVQLFLLSAIISIIYNPLTYLFHIPAETVSALGTALGITDAGSATQTLIVEALKQSSSIPSILSPDMDQSITSLDFSFLSFNLTDIASQTLGKNLLIPILAGASSYVLCLSQNLLNVLQKEQSKFSQYGMMIFSVLLSLYLGFFVPAGIALYWIFSNLFSVLQQILLNLTMDPKKHVDYQALEKSRRGLADIESLESKHDKDYVLNKKRERADYKRFFHVVNKHLVIYSEKSGFYKYFEDVMEELLRRSNITIHYVTSDPNDQVFDIAEKQPRIRAYYIGNKKLITLMMRMEADIVMMTTPDLDKYYIKRSLVQKDIEYIYIPHDPMSMHMGFSENALDHFDTIFCTGPHIEREVRATEKIYGLPPKNLVHFGYPFMEKLMNAHQNTHDTKKSCKQILIAPSWQEDNLLDSCIDTLIHQLYGDDYRIVVRPHPEYCKRFGNRMDAIIERYREKVGELLVFETDFSSNESIWRSDLLITDWSGIAVEFCFSTKRPALFVNTKMKVENPNWQRIECIPVEISLRNQIGVAVEKDKLGQTAEIVKSLLDAPEHYTEQIEKAIEEHFYNLGSSAQIGAMYILKRLKEKQSRK